LLASSLQQLPNSQCQTAVGISQISRRFADQSFLFDVFVGAGLVICPSRELAKQTHDIITHYCTGMPQEIRCCLAIGGIPVSESMEVISRSVMFDLVILLHVRWS
jgi:superfamily II DNA/RNA helicase